MTAACDRLDNNHYIIYSSRFAKCAVTFEESGELYSLAIVPLEAEIYALAKARSTCDKPMP